jgi:hypothetical protein
MKGLRSFLYLFARTLGDANAVAKGRVPRRVTRRIVGRETSRWLARIFR